MIPRIKEVVPQEDFKLMITIDSGEKVIYNVEDDIEDLAEFSVLKTEYGLFKNFEFDESRTVIYWNDWVDLPSDTLLEYGSKIMN